MSRCRNKALWHSTMLHGCVLAGMARTVVGAAIQEVLVSPVRHHAALLRREETPAEGEASPEGEASSEAVVRKEEYRKAYLDLAEAVVAPLLSPFPVLPQTPAG